MRGFSSLGACASAACQPADARAAAAASKVIRFMLFLPPGFLLWLSLSAAPRSHKRSRHGTALGGAWRLSADVLPEPLRVLPDALLQRPLRRPAEQAPRRG